jgi:hypothetical protein
MPYVDEPHWHRYEVMVLAWFKSLYLHSALQNQAKFENAQNHV